MNGKVSKAKCGAYGKCVCETYESERGSGGQECWGRSAQEKGVVLIAVVRGWGSWKGVLVQDGGTVEVISPGVVRQSA